MNIKTVAMNIDEIRITQMKKLSKVITKLREGKLTIRIVDDKTSILLIEGKRVCLSEKINAILQEITDLENILSKCIENLCKKLEDFKPDMQPFDYISTNDIKNKYVIIEDLKGKHLYKCNLGTGEISPM